MPYRCVECHRLLRGNQLARHLCVRRSTLLVFGAVVLLVAGLFAGLR